MDQIPHLYMHGRTSALLALWAAYALLAGFVAAVAGRRVVRVRARQEHKN